MRNTNMFKGQRDLFVVLAVCLVGCSTDDPEENATIPAAGGGARTTGGTSATATGGASGATAGGATAGVAGAKWAGAAGGTFAGAGGGTFAGAGGGTFAGAAGSTFAGAAGSTFAGAGGGTFAGAAGSTSAGAAGGTSAGAAGNCMGAYCNWTLLATAQPTGSVDNVAFDPRESNIVYATAGVSFYRSDDSGKTWQVAARTASRFNSIAFPKQTAGTILAGSDDGIIESRDRGNSWGVKSLSGLAVHRLLSHPADQRVVLAAIQGGGLLRSLDGGVTWLTASNGVPVSSFDGLAGDPSNPARMWASIEMADATGVMSTEVLETTDTGVSWHPAIPLTTGWQRGLAQCAADPRYLIAGAGTSIVASSDGGAVWNVVAMPGVNTDSVAIGGQNCKTLFVANFVSTTQSDLYRSLDGGTTVTGAHTKGMEMLHAPYIRQFAFDPADPAHVFGATSGGLFESRDSADQWQLVPGIGALQVTSMTAMPTRREVWATTWGAGLWKWSAATNDWSPIVGGTGFSDYAFSVATSPADPKRILIGGWGNALLSEDGGVTYSVVLKDDNPYDIAFSPLDPQLVLAATHGGVVRSTDAGRSWVASASGIPVHSEGSPYVGTRNIRSVAFAADGRVYVGAELRGIYSSQDDGLSWTALASPFSGASVRCLESTTSGVYACSDSLGIAKLNGDLAQLVNVGLKSLQITGITKDGELLFATSSGGVSRQRPDGSWADMDSNQLPAPLTSVPVVYRDGTTAKLIVSTPVGIYARELAP